MRTYDDEKVATVINQALQNQPDNATHWSLRLMGDAEGISKSTVHRWFSLFGVKPHLSKLAISQGQSRGQIEGV